MLRRRYHGSVFTLDVWVAASVVGVPAAVIFAVGVWWLLDRKINEMQRKRTVRIASVVDGLWGRQGTLIQVDKQTSCLNFLLCIDDEWPPIEPAVTWKWEDA